MLMTEDKEDTNRRPNLKPLYEVLPAEVKGIIAFFLTFVLFIGAAMFLGPLLLEKQCWELEAKEGRFFKFNACNGDVIEITEQYLNKAKDLSKEPN